MITPFPIMGTLFGSAVFAMLQGVSGSKESHTDIPGFEGMHGRFSSVETVIPNWAGSTCPKRKVFTALYSKRCVKPGRGKINVF